jgi:hypothetical protein
MVNLRILSIAGHFFNPPAFATLGFTEKKAYPLTSTDSDLLY